MVQVSQLPLVRENGQKDRLSAHLIGFVKGFWIVSVAEGVFELSNLHKFEPRCINNE